MALAFLIALVCLSHALAQFTTQPCGYGYKCFPYVRVSDSQGIEVRRYDETTWITWEEHGGITDLTDYPFLVEYTERKLATYFQGENYATENLERTTPLKIEVRLFDLHHPRRVSFPVHVAPEDGIPAPYHPLFISQVPEQYIYVRRVSSKMKYLELLHAAAEFMADLAITKHPFDREKVNFVLYTSPKKQEEADRGDVDNEIWITRTFNQQSFEFGGYGGAYDGGFGNGGYGGGGDSRYGDDGFDRNIFRDGSDPGGSGYGHSNGSPHGSHRQGGGRRLRPTGGRQAIRIFEEKRKQYVQPFPRE